MLKVLFLRSMSSGISYYRMWQYQDSMNRQKIASAAMPWFNYDDQNVAEWQFEATSNPRVYATRGTVAGLTAEADVVVVQYLHTKEALCVIEALKARFSRKEGSRIYDWLKDHPGANADDVIARLSSKGREADWIRGVLWDSATEADYPEKVFLTEIDDCVLDAPTSNPAFMQYQPGFIYQEVIREQMRALDGVICSTRFLADMYSAFNKNTYVVENSLDFRVWDKVRNKRTKDVRIGWMGGDGHQEDLRTIEAPLKAFLKKHTNVYFYCVNGVPDFFRSATRVVPILKWYRIDKYPAAIGKLGFDIGLAPLVDNNFTRGKSNLRKLEYGGLKIPVIAANVGHFAQTVKHGKDGFLYSSPEEFTQALESLVFNKKLRVAMGRYNYADVKANFNTDVRAREYVEILQQAVAKGQTTRVDVSSNPERSGASTWIAEPVALMSR